MQELDSYINKVKNLPPAPRILPKILQVLNQPDRDSSEIVDLITFDPSLTARLLQLCNSAFFASGNPVSDVQEAVGRLGFNQVYRMVATLSGAQALSPAQKGYGIAHGELWKHSVTTALAAEIMAKEYEEDASVAFTAGLLHDIGKVILSEALESVYQKVIDETETNQQSLLEAEKKLIGVEHAELGGRLLALWKFPANLVAAVWSHHQPANAASFQRLASFVYLGNMIAHFMGFSYGHQAFAFRGRAEALKILEMSPDALPQYMIRTFERIEAVEAMFRVT